MDNPGAVASVCARPLEGAPLTGQTLDYGLQPSHYDVEAQVEENGIGDVVEYLLSHRLDSLHTFEPTKLVSEGQRLDRLQVLLSIMAEAMMQLLKSESGRKTAISALKLLKERIDMQEHLEGRKV